MVIETLAPTAFALVGSSSIDRQDVSNCIAVVNGANAVRELIITNEGNASRQQDPNGPIK